jgi:hypothetical protein
MYEHMGCEIYNEIKADNGVTRYNLCYRGAKDFPTEIKASKV